VVPRDKVGGCLITALEEIKQFKAAISLQLIRVRLIVLKSSGGCEIMTGVGPF
jgi:hypothetical protein